MEEEKTTIEKGQEFLEKMISFHFPGIEFEYIDGKGDGGIDAFTTIDTLEGTKEFILIQSKYGESYCGVDTIRAEIGKIRSNLKNSDFPGISGCFKILREILERGGSLNVILFTSHSLKEAEIKVLREELSYLDVDKLKYDCLAEDDCKSCSESLGTYMMNLRSSLIDSDDNSVIVKIKASEYYLFLKSFKEKNKDLRKLFNRNIRYFKGNTKVNNDIKESLRNDPKNFHKKNNGLKMICNSYKINDNTVEIESPNIISGCQTTGAITEVFKELDYLGDLEKNPAYVIITIIDVSKETEESISALVLSSNNQNKVSTKELDVLNPKVKAIISRLTKNGYPTEVKKGSIATEEGLKFKKGVIEYLELSKTWASAIFGVPGSIYQSPGNCIASSDSWGGTIVDIFYDSDIMATLGYLLTERKLKLDSAIPKLGLEMNKKDSIIIISIMTKFMLLLYPKKDVELERYFDPDLDDKDRRISDKVAMFLIDLLKNQKEIEKIEKECINIFDLYTSSSSRARGIYKDYPSDKNISASIKSIKLSSADKLNDIIFSSYKKYINKDE